MTALIAAVLFTKTPDPYDESYHISNYQSDKEKKISYVEHPFNQQHGLPPFPTSFPEANEIRPSLRTQGDHVLRKALGFPVLPQHLEQNARTIMQPRLLSGVVGHSVHRDVFPDRVHQLGLADQTDAEPFGTCVQQFKNCGTACFFLKK